MIVPPVDERVLHVLARIDAHKQSHARPLAVPHTDHALAGFLGSDWVWVGSRSGLRILGRKVGLGFNGS